MYYNISYNSILIQIGYKFINFKMIHMLLCSIIQSGFFFKAINKYHMLVVEKLEHVILSFFTASRREDFYYQPTTIHAVVRKMTRISS